MTSATTISITGEFKFIDVRTVYTDDNGIETIGRCVLAPTAPAISDETQALKYEHHTPEVIEAYNNSLNL